MPFVKLDCGILDSSVWIDKDARDLFITALLMADPFEVTEPTPELAVRAIEPTGFVVEPGWYGIVRAAGIGIIRRAGIDDVEAGLAALERLAATDTNSRSKKYDGRRLVRVDGGFIALNYDDYRMRDYTTAERSRRYRLRKAGKLDTRSIVASRRDITQAEGDGEGHKHKNTSKEKKSAVGVIPSSLRTPNFEAAWSDWEEYRKQSGFKPWAEITVRTRLKEFEGYGPEIAAAAIRQSIANGWQGIFCDKIGNNGSGGSKASNDRRKLGSTPDREAAFANLGKERTIYLED